MSLLSSAGLSRTRLLVPSLSHTTYLTTSRAVSTTFLRPKYTNYHQNLFAINTHGRKMSSTPAPTQQPSARVKSLDHIVLTVSSIEATVSFYTTHLGMAHETFSSSANVSATTSSSSQQPATRHALRFGAQKINLHLSGHEFEPKAANVKPGSADLCFLTDEGVDGVLQKLRERGVEVLEGGGVVERTGAKKSLRSVYVRDPDGNLVE